MTARPRAAKTTVDPSTFDVDGWIQGFKPAIVKVPLYQRADLMPRLIELQAAIEKARPKEDQEAAFDEGGEYVELIEEHNALAEQLEESVMWFEFGPGSKPALDAAHAKADADGVTAEDENRVLYEMAETMLNPRVPGAALVALRNRMGDPVFMTLYQGWREALTLSKSVDAPFSPLPSLTPPTGE